MRAIRHGDVVLREIATEDCPANAEWEATDVLMAGEMTGHHHRVRDGAIRTAGERRFLASGLVDGVPSVLTHEEHKTLEVPPGLWEIIRQREYEPRIYSRPVND